MFHFPGCPSHGLLIHPWMTAHYHSRVPPFGYPGIKAYLQLPQAFRSLSRPSSAISALASTLRSCSLDLRLAIQIFDLNHSVGSRRLAFPSEIRSMPVHIDHCFLRLLRAIINLDCLFRFFPVQFSRCVEVSTCVDPSKRYRNHHLVSSQIPSLASLANYYLRHFRAAFASLSGSFASFPKRRPRI